MTARNGATMPKPLRFHLALLIASACALAITLYVSRPTCECVLGGVYVDPSDPADCAIHGAEME